jgi:hypothetical protein
MSNRLLIKKSSVAAKVPVVGDLEYGELAINYTDEKIYFKNASNVIRSFNALSGAGTVTSVGGAGTVSGLTLTGTVTSSGSLTLGGTLAVLPSNFASQTANTVLAAPDGAAGTPTFRNLTLNDLPDAWVKKSVGAATTAALTINTAQVTIDGVTLAASTRVLIKNQAAAGENGIYTGVTTTTWVRTPDADTASEIAGAFVNVDAGTVNGGRVFDNDFKSTDTLGTTAMNWSQNVDVGYFTTVGNSFATLADPTAITFPRINADNTVSALAAAAFRTAIGAGTSSTTGTVTSVAALTLGTTGTDITSTVATGTTTAVITLNVPTASAANRGALSAADWTTFNNKVGSLTDTLATVTARGATTSTAITLSGTLSFAQPVGLSFANGQYIKDNGASGLVIYSGANINLTGTTVVTGTASVSGTLSTTGLLTGAFNSAAVIPPSLAGFTLGWNYTNGGGEVDFWNTYTPGADSFHWYQRTATPTATKLMALNTTGLTITGLVLATTGLYAGEATSGVTRGVVTSEGNFLSFYAAETTARVQLGRDVGISGGAGLALGGSTYALIAASDTAGTALHFKLSAAASTATTSPNMSLTATGLGLGTTVAPGANGKGISIYTSDYPRLSFRNSTTGDATTDGTQLLMSGLDFYLQNQEAGALIFNTSAAERMRITSAGGLSFGSTGTAYGTSGQVLQSNAAAAPTWVNHVSTIAATTPILTSAATGAITLSHATSGVTAGTYNNVTVNTFGHVTAGSNVAYLTALTDTLATVTARGNTTTTSIQASNLNPAYTVSDFDAIKAPGLYQYDGAMTSTPNSDANYRTIEIGSSTRYSQIALNYSSDGMWFRRRTDAVWSTWRQVWHSGNLTNLNQLTNGPGYGTGTVTAVTATTPIVSSGGTTPNITHATSGATAGTYNNVTVNTFGHVTAGSNTAYLTGESDTLATVTARGNIATSHLIIPAGEGNALGFWNGSTTYSLAMGSSSAYQYGTVTDYSLKMSMGGGAGRGFTWGQNGVTPIASLNSTSGNMQIAGTFSALSKSFLIDHPTKPGMQLRYGSLEGPENGVYIRGRLKGNKIELPEYWTKLVDPDSITVNLTAIGKSQGIYVEDIIDNVVYVGGENVNCFYTVFAERVDIAKLEVEIV